MIFCAALLTLIVIIFNTSYQEDKRFSEILSLDRLQTLDNSIQFSIKEAFISHAGINVTFRKVENPDFTDVMFNETVPNDISAFRFDLDYIKLLTETEYTNIFLNISHIKETLPLLVEPYNILYTHDFENNQIKIIPEDVTSQSHLKGYFFQLANVEDAICINPTIYTTPPANFQLRIYGIETTTQAILCDLDVLINPDGKTTISMGTINYLTIEIDNGGIATITNNQGGSPIVASILYLDPNVDYNKTKVVLPGSIIRISDPDFNVFRKDSIRIL